MKLEVSLLWKVRFVPPLTASFPENLDFIVDRQFLQNRDRDSDVRMRIEQ